MLIKYIRYIIIGGLIILSGVTVVGLTSSQQPQTTVSSHRSSRTVSSKNKTVAQTIQAQETPPSVFTATVILGGDIMVSRTIGYENKKQGYDRIFGGTGYNPINAIAGCRLGGCLLFFNLESQFSPHDNDVYERTYIFKANTGNIAVLQGLRGKNTMAVSLANNHVSNAGGEGVETTHALLDQYGFYHVGAGTSKEQAQKILTFTHNNIRRCVAGYSYDGNGGNFGGKPLYRNKVDKVSMIADLGMMKTQLRCDIKAMILHRGIEYQMKPNTEQISLAHSLIDSGLDILIGAHPHVPSTIEIYNGKYIFYSLGNALFDQDRGKDAIQKGMDTIRDEQLKKNTVPTYITLFPEILATKTDTGTSLSLLRIHTTRLEKGLYTPNDIDTEKGLLQKIGINQ